MRALAHINTDKYICCFPQSRRQDGLRVCGDMHALLKEIDMHTGVQSATEARCTRALSKGRVEIENHTESIALQRRETWHPNRSRRSGGYNQAGYLLQHRRARRTNRATRAFPYCRA